MSRRSITRARTVEIFEKLQSSKEYRHGFAEEKYRIIAKLLTIEEELLNFAQAPEHGFPEINGFFTECCARFSCQLPRNTPKGQYISETIIANLHQYGECNPDYIWLSIRGKHITITGIGEIKSHLSNIAHKPHQCFFQEKNIRSLIDYGTITSIVSRRYHVTLADPLTRYLILPRSTNVLHVMPASMPLGWEVRELEFTFPEMLFLEHVLLQNIPYDPSSHEVATEYAPDAYEAFAREILKRVEEVIKEFFHDLFPLHDQDAVRALALWSLLYHSIPTEREAMETVLAWAEDLRQEISRASTLLVTPPSSPATLDEKEKVSYEAMAEWVAPDSAILIPAFLSRVQEIKNTLLVPPELLGKQEVSVLALL